MPQNIHFKLVTAAREEEDPEDGYMETFHLAKGSTVRISSSLLKKPVLAAYRRIGLDLSNWLEWMLRFAALDLTALSPGERLTLSEEVEAFTALGIYGAWNPTNVVGGRNNLGTLAGVDCRSDGWGNPPGHSSRPTDDDLIYLHTFSLERLREVSRFLLPDEKETRFVYKGGGVKVTDCPVFDHESDCTDVSLSNVTYRLEKGVIDAIVETPVDAFKFILIYLLGNFHKDITRCAECMKVFIARRYNQAYCSTRCQNRVAARKRRATPPDRVGKRGRPAKAAGKIIQKQKAKTKTSTKGGKHGTKKR